MERITTNQTVDFLGKKIKIFGWVSSRRDHGKIVFLDLRDREGILQVVTTEELAKGIKEEYVIEVEGEIRKRPERMVNPKINTGEIELVAEKIKILSKAKPLPFSIDTDGYEINESVRLKYRYLDLRRKRMLRNLIIRHRVIKFFRDWLTEHGFIEVETPILSKQTPEGARDFVVPARLQPGKFYALPQSPQQYKQLLMVAGIEKYYQIAKCFRDEDPRADRAYGEFTQLDIEISFPTREEILNLIENLFIELVKKFFPEKKITQIPFPRLAYEEVMKNYNTDKPDLRKNKEDKNELAFCFIVDWPLFEKTEEREINPMHHPFTAPKEEEIPLLDKDPMKVHSWQYDFVLNGYEIGGGSIRITNPEIQTKIFQILGHSKKEIQQKFGHLLRAFEYGVPPHGGIAIGLDRFLAVILGEPNVREVIAFPLTAGGRDLMMDSPVELEKEKMNELGISIKKRKKQGKNEQ